MRKFLLVDCNPQFIAYTGRETDPVDALYFECPEGHAGCSHTIPFTPAIGGEARPVLQRNGAQWERSGETFETLTLSPSIRRIRRYESREEAIAAGCIPEYITESMLCAFHGFVKNGTIEFCSDSK